MSNLLARLIAYFFVGVLYAVGPLLLLIAIGTSIPKARFVLASVTTEGNVIGLERGYSKQFSKEVYRPVVRFTARDGQTHLFVADSRAGLVALKQGDTVRVLYLKDQPEIARIDSIPQLWMPQLILGFVGALFTALAAQVLLRRGSPQRVSLAR